MLHTQFFVHLCDHTPLKRTFVISKGKSLKIVDSDEDYNSTSDEEVKETTPKQVLNDRDIGIEKQKDIDKDNIDPDTNINSKPNEDLQPDKEFSRSEENSSTSESASPQEGTLDLINGIIDIISKYSIQ